MKEILKADKTLVKILPAVQPLNGLNYIPSQFTLTFDNNGKKYVYNTLTRQCLEAELPARYRSGEGYDELIKKLFLVPEGKDECGFYNSISSLLRVYSRKNGCKGFTIIPTLACNARCVYCYEKGMRQVTMTPETVEQIIRYIMNTHSGDTVSLYWFGGEPLLCADIIDRICESLHEAGLKYHSSMITNGSLITPEIIAKMKGTWNLNKIQISMDGAENDYITRKRYYHYNCNYRRVMEVINAMAEADIRVSIRCNVDEENWNRIPEFLEDAKSSITHKEQVKLYFAPLYGERSGKNGLSIWKKVLQARPLIEAAGFITTSWSLERPSYLASHCMADGSGVVIGPDGSLYACEHLPPGSRFGDIWHGVTDENARYEFCRTDRTREKCRKCTFLPDCTSFASCPIQDRQCREVREMKKIAYLRRMIDNMDKELNIEEEIPFC